MNKNSKNNKKIEKFSSFKEICLISYQVNKINLFLKMVRFFVKDSTPNIKDIILDGWAEGPYGHGKYASSTDRENEYFFQWIHPMKLRRLALKLPIAYRCTHGLADDLINDDMGILIPDNPEETKKRNKLLKAHLRHLGWIREMRKFTGFLEEQGESIFHLIFNEPTDDNYEYLEMPIHENQEIVGIEAFNRVDYNIIKWDDTGQPEIYNIKVKNKNSFGSHYVRVHGSRVMRYTNKELNERETGYPILAVIYDTAIVILNIVKACGEAAYRWGTGHPLILTKNITEDVERDRIKKMIGIPTRRSWHILPSEFIQEFKLIGQAGEMLNLDALKVIAMEQIIAATKIPKAVFAGEVQVATGEVEDRSYFGKLYEHHVGLAPFVRRLFGRDVNIRRILNGVEDVYEIDWGVRQVLNKLDEQEYRQRGISIAIAATTLCTIDECRGMIDMPPLGGEEGEIILGLLPFYADEANNAKEEVKSTKDQSIRGKDLEKDKSRQGTNTLRENKKRVKDALNNLRKGYNNMEEFSKALGVSPNSFYKIMDAIDQND